VGERPRAVEGVVVIDSRFWQGRRVLLTGHTGFKGGWLTIWLQSLGAEVTGLALAPTPRSLFVDAEIGRDCRSNIVDVRDADAVKKVVLAARPEVVFHLAAQALVRPSYADAAATWMSNTMGTIHVLDALRACDDTRAIVVVTSDKCYEQGRIPEHAFGEDDPLGGHDPYSSSKAAAEIATASWRRSFFDAAGVGVATARAGNVIGGGDWAVDRLIPDLVRSAIDGREVPIRSPHATRPWQHVLDPLSGYLLLAQRLVDAPALHAGAWNFGPEHDASATVSTVASRFVAALERGARWRLAEDASLHEAAALSLDTTKAQARLGWFPRLSLDEALALTADAYRVAIDRGDQRSRIADQIDRHARTILLQPESAISS